MTEEGRREEGKGRTRLGFLLGWFKSYTFIPSIYKKKINNEQKVILARRRLHVDEDDCCQKPVNNYFHLTPKIGPLWEGGGWSQISRYWLGSKFQTKGSRPNKRGLYLNIVLPWHRLSPIQKFWGRFFGTKRKLWKNIKTYLTDVHKKVGSQGTFAKCPNISLIFWSGFPYIFV